MTIEILEKMPGHLIRRVQQISAAIFSEEMAEYDLTSVQFVALAAIADTPTIDATRLAYMIDFDRATIGGVIDRLERKRLVERTISTTDKRIKVLSATPAGRALITVSFSRVEAVQQRLLSALSPVDQDILKRLLETIVSEHMRSR